MKYPKVLVYDLEIAPDGEIIKRLEKLGGDERHVLQSMNAVTSHITCVSYMWMGERKVYNISLKDFSRRFKSNPADDSLLLREFRKVYDKADYTVAHYGEKFDRVFLNTRVEKAKLDQLTPSKLRDTWRILRFNFKLPNNRLDTALKFFNSPYQKPPLDWAAWKAVAKGSIKAFGPMIKRCNADVRSLEWFYRTILVRYDNQAPNPNLYTNKRVCCKCGSKDVVNDRYLPGGTTALILLFRCKDCKGYSRLPVSGRGKLR